MTKPRALSTQHVLPFEQLSWEAFERLCMRLAVSRGYALIEHTGSSGHDGGVDLVAWDGENRIAIQCKRVKKFTAADGIREIDKLQALEHSARPQRVIFMVTCQISSEARSKIRKAWSRENDGSCEFHAVTELDAEVRSDHTILRDFFLMPTGDADHGAAEVPASELNRLANANIDFISSTQSFQFQRLVHTIAEVEQAAGRLEASRVLNAAFRHHQAVSRLTERRALRICEDLDLHPIFRLNWKLRRMLARVVGDVVGLQVGVENHRLVGAFCEPRLSTTDGALLLAEAASEHTAAARAIGAQVLRNLLLSKQPQAAWQLLRRWPIVSPVLGPHLKIDDLIDVENASLRRMLFLTQLRTVRHSSTELERFIDIVGQEVSALDQRKSPGSRFYQALTSWSAINTNARPSRGNNFTGAPQRIDALLHLDSWTRKSLDKLPSDIAQALELDSIERDLLNAEGAYRPHPSERYSEGRYGHTRHYVRVAINLLPSSHTDLLLSELLDCFDEGIRWAVAAELQNWWTLVDNSETASSLLFRLIADPHPWVVRETLQQLSTDPLLCLGIGIDLLLGAAANSQWRAEEEGWATAELTMAIRRISALEVSA